MINDCQCAEMMDDHTHLSSGEAAVLCDCPAQAEPHQHAMYAYPVMDDATGQFVMVGG